MDLTGKLLIAMPGMGDPRFEHSVVLMCKHGASGAMGLIVNKPAPDVSLADLLDQLDIDGQPEFSNAPLRFGGPVEGARGFVLHGNDYDSELHSMEISETFRMTATLDILEDIAVGRGPAKKLMLLGYSGWGPGQLEGEIAMNGWLTSDADLSLVFDTEDDDKWTGALQKLGIDPLTLSAAAGRA
jgi:putative transcriptional regulator